MSSVESPEAGRGGAAPAPLAWLFADVAPGSGARSAARVWTIRVLALAGVLSLLFQARMFFRPELYAKDFKQEYLIARAVLDRADPYAPEAELAARYLPQAEQYALPSLHPPGVAVLAAPFGLVSFPVAAAVWLLVELALLVVLGMMATSTGPSVRFLWAGLAVACILLLWLPVVEELQFGQLNVLLAVLLAGSWFAMRSGRGGLAGVLLGLAAAVKLYPAVIVAYLLIKRQWSAVIFAAMAFLAVTGLGVLLVGIDGMRSYAAELSSGTRFLRAELNFSIYGSVLRVFTGGLITRPFIDAPSVGAVLAPLSMLAVWGIVAVYIWRARDPKLELAAGIAGIVLAGPICWRYYEVLLIWPLFVLARRLYEDRRPLREAAPAVVGFAIAAVPGKAAVMNGLALGWTALFGPTTVSALGQNLPAVAMLPFEIETLGPALVLVAILIQLRRSEPSSASGSTRVLRQAQVLRPAQDEVSQS